LFFLEYKIHHTLLSSVNAYAIFSELGAIYKTSHDSLSWKYLTVIPVLWSPRQEDHAWAIH
jgi:hypothetical protein